MNQRPYRLSATFVQRVTDPGRYGDGRGGNGLSLLVKRTKRGDVAKSWAQRVYVEGRARNIGIGAYPIVTLTEARRRCADNAAALRRGESIVRTVTRTVPTFIEATDATLAIHAGSWKPGSKTEKQWRGMFEEYVSRQIGRRQIDEVTAADVLKILAPLQATKAETARKLKQRLGMVFKWAVTQGLRPDDPTATIAAALPRSNGKTTAHHRALPHGEVAGAIARVLASEAGESTKAAFEFLVLTAARSGEVRGGKWEEVDIEAATWTVPPSRTKTGQPHAVPLSDRATAILEAARMRSDGDLVFPSVRGKVLSDNTLSKLLRDNEIAMVPHGARSSFRDWCGENGVDRELAESCLAHSRPGVEAAYARSDLLARRRDVMQAWSDYLNASE